VTKAIYVDFDDVLSETARMLTGVVEREFGKVTAFENIFSFDLTQSFGLDAAEAERLSDMFHDTAVLMAIAPVAGAAEVLAVWREAGAEIHIVTGRPPSTDAVSRAWLAENNIPYDRLTFVDKYARHYPPEAGVDILTLDALRSREFAMAIDDSPTAIRFLAEHTAIPIVIFDRPWNVALGTLGDPSRRCTRCATWPALLEQVPDPVARRV